MFGPVMLIPENVKLAQNVGLAWTRRRLACAAGDYIVAVPSEGGHGEDAILIRKGRPFLLVGSEQTSLLDESGKRIIFQITPANSHRVSMISYEGYDQVQGAFVENVDIGADGTLDYRTTKVAGRDVKQEYRVGERWLEVVRRDGLPGVIFGGRFMAVADAIKLSEKATPSEHK
jgi:hypothetical protein